MSAPLGDFIARRAETRAADRDLDPTSRLIIDEARRRGIAVEILSPRAEYFRLTLGARSLVCRESLSQLTHAVALSRCDDKRTTSRLFHEAGLRVPDQIEAADEARNEAFLAKHGAIVVKPAQGEQGKGISVGVTSADALADAIERAAAVSHVVLLEEVVEGDDLRLVVIAGRVVAAAVRRPPTVAGDGASSVAKLIAHASRARSAATSGEAKIPLDAETERCVRDAGFALSQVLPAGQSLTVRKTANVHTGGTIHDVTAALHPKLAEVACRAAQLLDIPVVGLDLIVRSPRAPEYAILEANERPGLCNHEPQRTAERFVDFLFPESANA